MKSGENDCRQLKGATGTWSAANIKMVERRHRHDKPVPISPPCSVTLEAAAFSKDRATYADD